METVQEVKNYGTDNFLYSGLEENVLHCHTINLCMFFASVLCHLPIVKETNLTNLMLFTKAVIKVFVTSETVRLKTDKPYIKMDTTKKITLESALLSISCFYHKKATNVILFIEIFLLKMN